MRQIRISKRQRPARGWLEPLPPDARDPDIARAKQLARRARRPMRQPPAHASDGLTKPTLRSVISGRWIYGRMSTHFARRPSSFLVLK